MKFIFAEAAEMAAERQAAQRLAVYQQLASVTIPDFPQATPEPADAATR